MTAADAATTNGVKQQQRVARFLRPDRSQE
jgi:hypothetical protein